LVQVLSLIGRDDRSLDGKYRVILPSRFRSLFQPTGVLTPHEDGCIALWTEDEFADESQRQHAREQEGPAARDSVRRWFSKSTRFTLDQQGRIAIPLDLREHASIDQEVTFVGVYDRVELWSKRVWEERDGGTSGSQHS